MLARSLLIPEAWGPNTFLWLIVPVSYFSITMIKLHGQKQFVETMAYFRLTLLEGRPIIAGEAWGQALGEQSKFDVEWGHKPSKAIPKDILPPSPHHIPQQHYQLGTKCSHTWLSPQRTFLIQTTIMCSARRLGKVRCWREEMLSARSLRDLEWRSYARPAPRFTRSLTKSIDCGSFTFQFSRSDNVPRKKESEGKGNVVWWIMCTFLWGCLHLRCAALLMKGINIY